MTTAAERIERLVERFDRNIDAYRARGYKEMEIRREFIDPFFAVLGWDMDNRSGYAEAYKDVIHEDAIKIGGSTKAPDYCFRIGGTRKFFVEAKKPAVDIARDAGPAYQLRRYAWSAKLPLSILTDFEEFAVYDCRIRPKLGDKPSVARTVYCTYDTYADNWDRIAGIFSKEAVLQGSFDKYAVGGKKRGTAEVDAEFLKEIEKWREALARNIALRNDKLDVRELNFAVQRTIDRIIFLRMAEDRGVEDYATLQGLINGTDVYGRLMQMFRRADDRYNSGLFHFNAEPGRDEPCDTLTPQLAIDDKVLKDIFTGLYYPTSPYEFSVLPTDILGNVYEQFLGKVIHLTAGHRAKVEEKPEVKKAGGVYYTPKYIVDYIVKHTVGTLIGGTGILPVKSGTGILPVNHGQDGHATTNHGQDGHATPGKTPRQISRLKVLDPACGSGSFLVGAYRFLLDYHRDYYLNDGPAKNTKTIYQGAGGQWYLTTAEKKRILLNNIYGVDIDSQAVEVTKLNLLLCVLENENQNTVGQMTLIHQRVLPDLSNNIKCGNSLIGPDFYEGKQLTLFDSEAQYRVNAFDWQTEFPQVFKCKNPGFDAVIGNPPYIRIHNLVDFYREEIRYIQTTFSTASFGKVDIYVAFVERGFSLLNAKGLLGFILPNKFMQSNYGVGLRTLICRARALVEIADFRYSQVFEHATIYTCLLFLSRSSQKRFICSFNSGNVPPSEFLQDGVREDAPSSELLDSAWSLTYASERDLLEKIRRAGTPLPDFITLSLTGVKTGANDVFIFRSPIPEGRTVSVLPLRGDTPVEIERSIFRPLWKAAAMKRYSSLQATMALLYPYERRAGRTRLITRDKMIADYPKAWEYLESNRPRLEARQKGKLKGSNWYGLSFASSLDMFDVQKIVTATLSPQNSFTIDQQNHVFPQGAGGGCGMVVAPNTDPFYLLGILNSALLTFYFQRISSQFQHGWYAYEPRYLARMPIRKIDFTDPNDEGCHGRIIELSKQMLQLHKNLAEARTDHAKTLLQRQIDTTDRQIDQLVYELYGLTEEEIAIVEGVRE